MRMGDQDQRPVHGTTSRAWLAAVGLAALSSGSLLTGAGAAFAEETPTDPACWTEVDENGETWEFCDDVPDPDGGTDDGSGEGGGDLPCDGDECQSWPGDGSGVPPGEEECVDLPVYEEPPVEEPIGEDPPSEEPPSEEPPSEEPPSEEPPGEEDPATEVTDPVDDGTDPAGEETEVPAEEETEVPSDEPTNDEPTTDDPWDPDSDVATCWSGYCMYVVETGQPILCADGPVLNDHPEDSDTAGEANTSGSGGAAGGGSDEDPNASVPTRVDAGLAGVPPRAGTDRGHPELLTGSIAATGLALVALVASGARRRRDTSA